MMQHAAHGGVAPLVTVFCDAASVCFRGVFMATTRCWSIGNLEHTITIRDASERDYEQWVSLWAQYNAFYGREGPTALSEDIVLSTWRRLFDPNEQVFCLVAEYGGRLVGLAHYIFHRNTITIEDTCYLQDLFAEPGMRGMGIGQKLMSAFYERANQAGTRGVYWHTHATNKTAMKLYDKIAANTEFVVYRSADLAKPT